MRALSLLQPWASLVVLGEKRYETRSWWMAYRGPVAICASQAMKPAHRAMVDLEDPFARVLRRHGIRGAYELPLGKVLGLVTIADWVKTLELKRLSAQELAFGDFGLERFAIRLEAVHRLREPIAVKGQRGLWTLPEDVAAAVAGQVNAGAEGPGKTQ